MSYSTVYRDLAICYDNMMSDRGQSDTYLGDAVKVITNLTSADDGTSISVYLLTPIHKSYTWSRYAASDWYPIYDAVNDINKYVIDILGEDLTTFVNAVPWEYACVPAQWAILCERANTALDTSDWIICS